MTKEALTVFSLYDIQGLKISVSAIVGKNGSGKSSVVDLIIRMINNLFAACLGESFKAVNFDVLCMKWENDTFLETFGTSGRAERGSF